MPSIRVLLVDDEPLARLRLRTLLGDCLHPVVHIAGEAADAVQAMTMLHTCHCDLVLLDIQMPGLNGLDLAQTLGQHPMAPHIVFVTAHTEHALQAFDVQAIDYLTKPVRPERLQRALEKTAQLMAAAKRPSTAHNLANRMQTTGMLLIQDRGKTEQIELHDVLYAKAELKYVTLRTTHRSLIYDGSLVELEQRFEHHWVRIHRSALVAKHALKAIKRSHHTPHTSLHGELNSAASADNWFVQLKGIEDVLMVSRRQLAAVKHALHDHPSTPDQTLHQPNNQ
jgi:two-component system, LytTR family, response regulator AlgR